MTEPTNEGATPKTRVKNADRPAEHVSTADQRAGAQREEEHTGERRQRRRRGQTQVDEFYIPVEEIPPDLEYQWKRFSIHGQEDPFYLARMREQGWEPVPPSRHPTWVPPGYNAPYIIKGGQILMDTPKVYVQEARAEAKAAARQQVVEAEQRLGKTPDGEMTRDHAEVRPRVVKQVGRMVSVPIEE